MGLGKTAQLCVHYAIIAQSDLKLNQNRSNNNYSNGGSSSSDSQKFLVICPATVLQHWNREMNTWNPLARVLIMHTISPTFNQLQTLGIFIMKPN